MVIISYGQGTDLHVIKKRKYVYKYESIIYKKYVEKRFSESVINLRKIY